jgi:hypothetical protein
MDPTLNWDKAFVSPSSTKKSKSSLNDRATFWPATSSNMKDRKCMNPYRIASKQPPAMINKVSKSKSDCRHGSKCGVCNECIDIWCAYTHALSLLLLFFAYTHSLVVHACYLIESGE